MFTLTVARLLPTGYPKQTKFPPSVVTVHYGNYYELWNVNRLQKINYVVVSWPPLWSSGQSSWLQNGDVLFLLWGRNWIYISYLEDNRPPLWFSGQSSWNGDVLCPRWGTNWIYVCYIEESRHPLWSSGQRSWLQNSEVLCFLWGTNWIYICYV
jgi:hypothetical protein